MKRYCNLLILFFIFIANFACKQPPKGVDAQPSFKSVIGIHYTEVRRTFKNGLSFNSQGFQLIPDWRFSFISTDSINIYSPIKKRFFNCPVIFDHDSIFNVAWAWIKLRKLSKDSLVFQVLEVQNKEIIEDKSNLTMTIYADDYLKNHLHKDRQMLQRPSKMDTLYIRNKISLSERNPDSSFAGTEPPLLKSKSPLLTFKKVDAEVDPAESLDPKADYINPEYNITITKAYKDFFYSFVMIVDATGEMHFWRQTDVLVDKAFTAWQTRMMTGIVNGYLKRYLEISPGRTLGMPHKAFVVVNVTGKAG